MDGVPHAMEAASCRVQIMLARWKQELRDINTQARIFQRILLIFGVLIGLFLLCRFFIPSGLRRGSRPPSAANLRMIGLALHDYLGVYKCLPPAVMVDGAGRPRHSWRMLIAPHLRDQWARVAASYRSVVFPSSFREWRENRQGAFAAQNKADQLDQVLHAYDWSEPWNGPRNRELATRVMDAFDSPHRDSTATRFTDFAVMTGTETAWPPDRVVSDRVIRDGTSTTILVFEIGNSDIHWSEPRDLRLEDLPAARREGATNRLGNAAGTGILACFVDSTVQRLKPTTSIETLRAMFTIAGGERVDDQ